MPKKTLLHGNRRDFIKSTSLAAAALSAPFILTGCQTGPTGRRIGANDQIRVAVIGAGGKGASDTDETAKAGGTIVALCDVDQNTLNARKQKYPDALLFQDYRRMYERIGKDIDAIVVAAPDHIHAPASVIGMEMGMHCFCQKPLTHSVYEARRMRKLARDKKVATQMGNQGSAMPGLRRSVEVIQAGIIGGVRELHVWSNRPIWPQGMDRPPGSDPVPKEVDWDLWIGPRAMRPYKKGAYHTFAWRGWQDFGTGALGDMACHTVNMPFRALKMGYPTTIAAESTGMNKESWPKSSKIRFQFPAREGLPPLAFTWYDGNPNEASSYRPRDVWGDVEKYYADQKDDKGNPRKVPGSGCLMIGEKGVLFSPDDYGGQFLVRMNDEKVLTPADRHEAIRAVPQTIPRSPGHYVEWIQAIRGGAPAYSNFDIAAYLTEIILLGCVALQVGKKLDWDGPNMRATNAPEAAQFVKREYRKGWEV
jgi:predicted dehydrogenase